MAHTYREQNSVTDALAKAGAQLEDFGDTMFLKIPPMCIHTLLQTDIIGTYNRNINVLNVLPLDRGITQTNSNR